jgi:hypothetical protein
MRRSSLGSTNTHMLIPWEDEATKLSSQEMQKKLFYIVLTT